MASALAKVVSSVRPARPARFPERRGSAWRLALRSIAVGYLSLLVIWPVSMVFINTFAEGVGPVLATYSDPLVIDALRLTAIVAAWSVALNTVFGVAISLLLVRYQFPGKRALNALIDLPLSVSPVVVGLALVLVFNTRSGWLGGMLSDVGIQVLFATPSLILATTFVALPLVIREVVPVLQEIGIDQEQAARSLGAGAFTTFRRITLPAIKWGLGYGVILCLARSIGEFGAVKIVSGGLIGRTQTATLAVEQFYLDFEGEKAYAIASLLTAVSIISMVVVGALRTRDGRERKEKQ